MIREATSSDKFKILKFCKNTFSWGDYIKDVWDYWLKEGYLFVVDEKTQLGICHAFLSNNQIWIEGIRIHPNFRRKGLATKLVNKVEDTAKQNHITKSLMLIDTMNKSSLSMAKNLGYKICQTWNFYSLLPHENKNFEIKFAECDNEISFPHYVKSWRWLPLDKNTISNLILNHSIVYCSKHGSKTIGILSESEHFPKTLIVTLFSGSENNTSNVISFLQNYGFEQNHQRIQILSQEYFPKLNNLEHKISFYLMQKLLS